jgi:hypothetical protein
VNVEVRIQRRTRQSNQLAMLRLRRFQAMPFRNAAW